MQFARFTLVLLAALTATQPAAAAWMPNGTPQSPPNAAFQNHYLRGLAADGADGAYSIIQFNELLPQPGGTRMTLSAQRVDVLGNRPAPWTPGGTAFKTWMDTNPSGTFSVDVLPVLEDGAGGAIVPLVDHGLFVEYANKFRLFHVEPGAAVHPIGSFGDPNLGWAVHQVAAAADGAGGVLVIGLQQTFGPPPNPPPPGALFVQRVDATGASLWPDGGSGAPGPALIPNGQVGFGGVAVIPDGAGGGFFAWTDVREAGDQDLYVQHLDAAGGLAPGWPAGGVLVCGAAGSQSEPHLATDGAGGVLVVWRDDRDAVSRLYGNGVLASGALSPTLPIDGRQLPSSGYGDALVEVASDALGGCFVVSGTYTATFEAVTRLYRLDGAMETRVGWPEDGIGLTTMSPGVGYVGLVADGLGGAYISFRNGFGNTPPQGLFAQHFAGSGMPAPGWSDAAYSLSRNGQFSRLVRSGTGAIAAWDDVRNGVPGGLSVFAQRLVSDGPVAVTVSLASAVADEDGIALRWLAAGGTIAEATLERRTEATDWTALAALSPDGSGYLAYDDGAVEQDRRYGYRLVWQEGALTRTAGEVWLAASGAVALAIESPRPNPTAGPVTVALALPRTAAARLEIVDVAGRRVLARELGSLGAGRHVLTLGETGSLAPGVYLMRLVQGNESRQTRLLRVR